MAPAIIRAGLLLANGIQFARCVFVGVPAVGRAGLPPHPSASRDINCRRGNSGRLKPLEESIWGAGARCCSYSTEWAKDVIQRGRLGGSNGSRPINSRCFHGNKGRWIQGSEPDHQKETRLSLSVDFSQPKQSSLFE